MATYYVGNFSNLSMISSYFGDMEMFGYDQFAKAAALGSRNALRHTVVITADLRSSAVGKIKVTLTDISECGCQCKRSARLVIGSFIMLSMTGYTPFGARVVWINASAVGLEFLAPLHSSVLAHIIAKSQKSR